MEQLRLVDPLLGASLAGVMSCEHCRTVTWAGVAACSCEFGGLAVDEEHVLAIVRPSGIPGESPGKVADDSEIS
jgi:hypothetical protein